MRTANLRMLRLALPVVLLTAGLLACEPPAGRAVLFHYNGEDPYIDAFVSQIETYASSSFELETYDARNSQTVQNEQIALVLEEPPDLVIVNPVDRLGAYTIIRHLQELDIPVIFFNREPLERDLMLWDRTYYVGARAEQSARLQAELVMELFGGDPAALNEHDLNGDGRIQAVILKGEQGHQDAEIRTSEVIRSFQEADFDLDVLAVEVADWNRTRAYNTMEDLLRDHRALELVISNNDNMALGAIMQLRQQRYFRDTNSNGRIDKADEVWIPVVGIDGLADAVEAIEAGYLYGTVVNDSMRMADAIVELADAILDGRDPETISFPMEDGRYVWIDYQPFVLE